MKHEANRKTLGGALHGALLIVALVGITTLVAGRAWSDDKKQPPTKEQQKENEMMAKWAAAGTPGAFHKKLDVFVGDWKSVSKFWMAPGQEPQTSEGEMRMTWILGGRFLKQEYKGQAMGRPFEGMGLWGYDNLKKKYISSWVDTMSTKIAIELGTCDASGKTFTSFGSHDDPITGKVVKTKSITRVVNKDKHVLEMYAPGPDGKMFKNLEIVYTRK